MWNGWPHSGRDDVRYIERAFEAILDTPFREAYTLGDSYWNKSSIEKLELYVRPRHVRFFNW